nr:CerR family C-terminal domain-containing protein [uncultured Roseateles sp.]
MTQLKGKQPGAPSASVNPVRATSHARAPRATRADGDQTYARLLESAGLLFAAAGFAETTSTSIAKHAGADVASINYHFGSRNGLYQAVLAEAHRRVIRLEVLQQIASGKRPGSEKVRLLIDQFLQATSGVPGWPTRVLARELLAPTANAHVLLNQEIAPKLQIVLGILSGVTRIPVGEPALLRCLVSTGAPGLMMLVGANGYIAPLRDFVASPREDLALHLHAFAMGGLKAAGRLYAQNTGRASSRS